MLKQYRVYLPLLIIVLLVIAGAIYGPIPQPAEYHNFADQSIHWGIHHFVDVLSNFGFALVGLWGLLCLTPYRRHEEIINAWPGYWLFLIGLCLTALGSGYYHLDPDNASLIWDRIPIALTCAGLLAGVAADVWKKNTLALAVVLAILAVVSVLWWYVSETRGVGDLRFYLLFQIAVLILVPLWQFIYERPRDERLYFGAAALFYLVAKITESNDYQIASVLGEITGHTLKHIFATVAAALIVVCLIRRVGKAAPALNETKE